MRLPAQVFFVSLAGAMTLSTQAQTVQYVYDESGRLVGTVAPNGEAAFYTYDAAGNITAIRRVAAGAVAVGEFTPNAGAVGTTVTIWGSGFSPTPAQNSVRFNGVSATVVSASATALVVTVPAAATTGPIAVTSPSGSATSGTNFTVRANPGGPTITGFSPTMGAAGTPVTITGANFETAAGATRVSFNGRPALDAGASTTLSLNAVVPTLAGGGGRIRVATAPGSVESATDFVILPTGISAADVVLSRRATLGGPAQVLDIASPNKVAVLFFDAPARRHLTIDLTALAPTPTGALLPFEVHAPGSASPPFTGNVSASTRSIHLAPLPFAGTYAVFFRAGAATFGLSAAVSEDASVATDGVALNASIAFAGQSRRLTFNGTAGPDWVLDLSSVSMSGTSPSITYSVLRPDGTTLVTRTCTPPSSGCSSMTYGLPVTGTYTVVLTPNPGGSIGTFTARSWASNRLTGTLTVGTAATLTSTIPGQIVQSTFSGTAGQQLGLTLSNFTTSVSGTTLYVDVLRPDNTILVNTTFTAANTTPTPRVLDLPVLPTSGTYMVRVFPNSTTDIGATTTFSGQVLVRVR